MSPEAQRIAIAEASQGRIEFFEGVWYYWSGTTRFQCQDNDPLNDLNAMRSAVLSLPAELRNRYVNVLQDIVDRDNSADMKQPDLDFFWCNASAKQMAEAYSATLNLWTDEQ